MIKLFSVAAVFILITILINTEITQGQIKTPRQMPEISLGVSQTQSKTPQKINIKGTGLDGKALVYPIKLKNPIGNARVKLTNLRGTTAYGLRVYIGGDVGDDVALDENLSEADDNIRTLALPLERSYELERDSEYYYYLLVEPQNRQSSFMIELTFEPISLTTYKFRCGGVTRSIRALSFADLPNRTESSSSDDEDMGVFSIIKTLSSDIDGDGRVENIALANCSSNYQTYVPILFVFDQNGIQPLSSGEYFFKGYLYNELQDVSDLLVTELGIITGELSYSTCFECKPIRFEKFRLKWNRDTGLLPAGRSLSNSGVMPANRSSDNNIRPVTVKVDLCSEDPASGQSVVFSAKSFTALTGMSRHNDGSPITSDGLVSISLEQTIVADLNNDGTDEGIIWADCNYGGTGTFAYLGIYNLEGKTPIKIATLNKFPGTDLTINKISADTKGNLVVNFVSVPSNFKRTVVRKRAIYVLRNGKITLISQR